MRVPFIQGGKIRTSQHKIRFSNETIAHCLELISSGMTCAEISRQEKIPAWALWNWHNWLYPLKLDYKTETITLKSKV